MSTDAYRKCAKCGATPIQDGTVSFHRFPKPGKTNVERARAWAKYCWPEKDWTSMNALTQLFKSNKVLCKRHFKDNCYTDSSKKNLGKFSVPNIDAIQLLETSPNEKTLGQHSNDVPKVQVHKQSELAPLSDDQLKAFPLHVASKTGIDLNVKEKETKKNDLLQAAITQADVPLTLEDPINIVEEYVVDFGDGDQHVGEDHAVEICSEEQKRSTPDYNVASDSDDDYHPSKEEGDDDDEQSDDETGLPAQSALSTSKPTAKYTATLPTAKYTATLPTAKHTENLPTAKHTENLPTGKYIGNTKIQATDSKPPDKESHTFLPPLVLRKRTYGKNTIIKQYGHCRCCLKQDIHSIVNVWDVLECLNIKVSRDPRVTLLLCSECDKFLQEARRFRDMVAASQRTLLGDIPNALDPSEVKIPGSTIYLSQDQAVQGSAKKRRIVMLLPPSDATTSLHVADVKQGQMTMERPDTAGETSGAIPMGQMPEEMHEDRAFSEFSDYTDFGMDKGFGDDLSEADIDKLVKSKNKERAKFSCSMRENLITLLDCSTITPFTTSKGVPFDCIYCDANYAHFNQLRDHVEEKHKYEEMDFKHETLKLVPETIIRADISCIKCRICDEQFTAIDNLVQHLVNIHNKKYHNLTLDPPHNILGFDFSLDEWTCLDCKKIFPTFKKLRAHVNKHYGSFLCHQCGSKFLYPNAYSKHMKDHQKATHAKHICDVCGETFNYKKDLMYHTNRAHNDDTLTAKGLKRKLKVAVFIPPEETPGETYECVLCDKGMSFTSKTAAYMHRIGHLNNTRQGPFNCEMCEYTSPHKLNFKRHIQRHYGVKNYLCEICNKAFVRQGQWSAHMAMHLDLKMQCPLCDTTLRKKSVKRHMKNKHPDVTVQYAI